MSEAVILTCIATTIRSDVLGGTAGPVSARRAEGTIGGAPRAKGSDMLGNDFKKDTQPRTYMHACASCMYLTSRWGWLYGTPGGRTLTPFPALRVRTILMLALLACARRMLGHARARALLAPARMRATHARSREGSRTARLLPHWNQEGSGSRRFSRTAVRHVPPLTVSAANRKSTGEPFRAELSSLKVGLGV